MKLSRYEQETIIGYNEEEKTANIYTHNAALQRRLAAIAADRPEECRLLRTSHDGQAVEYSVPKRWVKVRPGRILTDEQLQKAREHAIAMLTTRRNGEAPTQKDLDALDEDALLLGEEQDDDGGEENPEEESGGE